MYLQQAQSQAGKAVVSLNLLDSTSSNNLTTVSPNAATAASPSDLFSSAASCPSLSPSPAPYAKSVASEQDLDFCDPRNLTVGISGSGSAPGTELSTVPCLGEDDLRGEFSFPSPRDFSVALPTLASRD